MKLPASTQRALAALDEPVAPAPALAIHGAAPASAFASRPLVASSSSSSSSSSSNSNINSNSNSLVRPTPLRLHFVGPPHTTVIRPGTVLTPRQCQKQPVLAIPISAMLRLPPSVRFLALCLALDPASSSSSSSSSTSSLSSPPSSAASDFSHQQQQQQQHHHHRPVPPRLHGVRADLVPVIHQDDERWIPLLHENGRWGAPDDPSHKPVIDFLAPVPAGPGPRRYVWLVWIQPDGVSAHDVLRATGLQPQPQEQKPQSQPQSQPLLQPPPLPPSPHPSIIVDDDNDHRRDKGEKEEEARVAADARRGACFDDERFEKELGLGDVVAANYFTCEPEGTSSPDVQFCGHR